jgi:hypothetical protein
MSIEDIADEIRTKNFTFQVVIPGTSFSHGKTTQEMALADSENLEAYLNRIARINKAAHMLVRLYSRNGTSFKPRGEHLIFLPKSEAVATTATNVAGGATNVAIPATNVAGFGSVDLPQKNNPMDTKDYIEFQVLKLGNEALKNQYDESKAKIKQLEKKVEDLHEENKQLIRTSSVQEDKHALALERQKLDTEREAKSGLNGLIGDLTKDPELIKMIAGFIKPDHPMFKTDAPALNGASEPKAGEVKYSEDKDANTVLNALPLSLSQKDGRTISAVFLLFQEFINKPDTLESAITTYIPTFNENN